MGLEIRSGFAALETGIPASEARLRRGS